jgi:protein SCO1/2
MRRRIALLSYGLGGAFVLIVCWFAIARPFQVLPRIRPMPLFLLRDQQGQWVDAEKLRGQLLVVSFTYTRCGDACDAMNRGVVALRDRLRADGRLGADVTLLTFSFDTDYDTPPVLQRYASRLGAEAPAWRFLTGDAGEVKGAIGSGFGVYYEPQPDAEQGEQFDFDQRVMLVDGQGVIRAVYDGARLDQAVMQRDIALVQREAASGPVMRPLYEASHLFLCYPQ